jgi:hypothetical protein
VGRGGHRGVGRGNEPPWGVDAQGHESGDVEPPGRERAGTRARGRRAAVAQTRRGEAAGATEARPRGAQGELPLPERGRGCGDAGAQGKRKGRGRGREREGEEEGSSPRGSKSGDHCLQNLGHHRGERERLLHRRNQMRERDQGARAWGRARALGARRAGPGWAGPHRGSKLRGTHNHRSEFNPRSKIRNGTKQRTRLSTKLDKEI